MAAMERVSQLQLFFAMMLILFSLPINFFMGPLSVESGFNGWLALIVGCVGGIGIAFLAVRAARLTPEESIFSAGQQWLGRVAHSILCLGFIGFALHTGATVLREVRDFLIQAYLPTTPEWVVVFLFGFCTIMAARSGLEAIFRCSGGFFFIVVGAALLTPLMVAKDILWPMSVGFLRHWRIDEIWNGAYLCLPRFGEMFLILFIYPSLRNRERTMRSLGFAGLGALLVLLLYYAMCILLFGPHLTAHLTYPTLELVRYIRIGDFLENLDPLLVALWVTALYLKTSLWLYIVMSGLGHLSGLRNAKPLAYSVGGVMIGLSMHMSRNAADMDDFQHEAWPTFALAVQLLPLLYLLAARWRRGRKSG